MAFLKYKLECICYLKYIYTLTPFKFLLLKKMYVYKIKYTYINIYKTVTTYEKLIYYFLNYNIFLLKPVVFLNAYEIY